MAITREDRDAYLKRLGLEPEPASVDALFRIHRAHAERVPYETLWIPLGDPIGIDTEASARRVARTTRGGYCFHLNGALSELLGALGYDVHRHVGGVHGPDGPSADALANHLVLTVRGLPSDGNPGGTWYVDCGLGDSLYEPVPLVEGAYAQAPFTLRLEQTPDGVGDWHLTHDPNGGFAGMAWRSADATIAAFADQHRWLSTNADSPFVKVPTAQLRDATGADALRGCVLVRVGKDAGSRDIDSYAAFRAVLGDRFRIDVGDALPELWRRLRAAHEKWDAAGRP